MYPPKSRQESERETEEEEEETACSRDSLYQLYNSNAVYHSWANTAGINCSAEQWFLRLQRVQPLKQHVEVFF